MYEKPTMAPAGAVRTVATKCLRILVADDNQMIRTALRSLLKSFGHSVDMAINGREAVEAAARHAYDVVFLDVQMPEMGGFEAARALRSGEASRGPSWIVGISAEAEDRKFFEAAEMDDFLRKPVRLTDLARVLSRLTLGRDHF